MTRFTANRTFHGLKQCGKSSEHAVNDWRWLQNLQGKTRYPPCLPCLSHIVFQHGNTRERRRQVPIRSTSPDSDPDEILPPPGVDIVYSPSPPPGSHHSEQSPPRPSHDQLSQQRFEEDQAEFYIYDLLRRFARAVRALAHYQCQMCIDELNELSPRHQQSAYVLGLVGRAHYEKLDYASVHSPQQLQLCNALIEFCSHRRNVLSKVSGHWTHTGCGTWRFTLLFYGIYNAAWSCHFWPKNSSTSTPVPLKRG